MNQPTSAAGRPPTGSTTTSSCCPMFSNPFFLNTYAPQATLIPPPPPVQQCFSDPQATRMQPPPPSSETAQQQQLNLVAQHQPTVSQHNSQQQRQQQQTAQMDASQSHLQQRPQDHQNLTPNSSRGNNNYITSSNNYNASFTGGPVLPLQQILSAQHLNQMTRNRLNNEDINRLINEHIQTTLVLNQLFVNNQFPSALGPVPLSLQRHANTTAPPPPPPQPTQLASSTQPIHQAAPVQQQPLSIQQQQQPTPVQQQRPLAPPPPPVQQQQQPPLPPPPVQQQQPPSATVQQQQQQPPPPPGQQPQNITNMPFNPIPQMEQAALALLANPQVANNIFGHIFSNFYFQAGIRPDQHTHLNSSQNFHHHLHGAHHHHHHHHHHGANGQANGQEPTVPVDSLAISESKPKGLNRAEIDLLTHYIHTDEKDSRTCVICLSKFELKSKIRPLSCNHAFHAKCVDKWLRANRTCPICRRDALKTYEGKIKRI